MRTFVVVVAATLLSIQVAGSPPVGAAPTATVSGTVTDDAGAPIAAVCVNAVEGDWRAVHGARAAADGTYRLDVPAGVELRVQFSDCAGDGWVEQWHDGARSFGRARVLVLGDGEAREGIDARLARGASVSGSVRAPDGAPLASVCVAVVVELDDGPVVGGWTRTGPAGTYTVRGVPAGPARVRAGDCSDVPVRSERWYGGEGHATATVLPLEAGRELTGVDLTLPLAPVLTGTVRDAAGPLADVCVQAVGGGRVTGSGRTGGDGSYRIVLRSSGAHRVQFVDCDGDPTHAGAWAAGSVTVAEGEVADVSTTLVLGEPANVSGSVRNVRGEAMTSACAVLYLADEFVAFSPVAPDGTYRIEPVGSGTYTMAVVGCDDLDGDGPAAWITDPSHPTVSYRAAWLGGAPVELDPWESPDPLAQGARLLALEPGAAEDVESCLGCGAVVADIRVSGGSVRASFELDGVRRAPHVAAPADDAFDYELACTRTGAGVATPLLAEGSASPLEVAGPPEGVAHDCVVRALDGEVVVADSRAERVRSPGREPTRAERPTAGAPAPPGRRGTTLGEHRPTPLAFAG